MFDVILLVGNFGQERRDFGQDFVILGTIFDLILVIVLILARVCVMSGRIL